MVSSLLTVPLTIGYLGAERYGLWMTIGSFIAFFSFADLGMGNGLVNAIAEANGHDDRGAAREYVSSAFFMLSAIAVAIVVLYAIVHPLVPWPRVFNVTSTLAAREADSAMAVLVGSFALNMPIGVAQRVQAGYQESFSSSLWQCLSTVLGLLSVLLAVHEKAGLPWLVAATSAPAILAALANGVVIFGRQRPWLLPRWRSVTRSATRKISQLGVLFFLLQIASAVAFSSDNIVAAQMFGSAAVAQYSVPMRLFGIPAMVFGMLFSPLWPAFGEAIARGDLDWCQRTLVRSLVVAIGGSGAVSLLLLATGSWVLRVWAGAQIEPSFGLMAGMGVWCVMLSVGGALAAFYNGMGVVRYQVVTSLLMAAVNLAMSISLAHVVGLAGIIWGTVIAYGLTVLVPAAVYVPQLLARRRNEPSAASHIEPG